jgi:hypothetical protein
MDPLSLVTSSMHELLGVTILPLHGMYDEVLPSPPASNTVSVKSAHAMWKVLMVQSCDNDILEGLAVANPPQTQNPLFFSWRD